MRKYIREVLQIVIKTVKFDFTGDPDFVFGTLEVNILQYDVIV